MYNYIFYTLYKYNIKDGSLIAKINAVSIVALALITHFCLLLSVIKKFAPHFYNTKFADSLPKNKSFALLIFIVLGVIVSFWYNKPRIDKLLAKRKPIPDIVHDTWDIFYVVLIVVGPIVPVFIIFWKR